ncbi:MAG: protein kinase [Ectothiorhodospiraceae bacterium]|nr:protein kinase [Ectothiorhodospiraceae bacterium]
MTSNDEPDKKGNSGLPATDSSSATREAKFSRNKTQTSGLPLPTETHTLSDKTRILARVTRENVNAVDSSKTESTDSKSSGQAHSENRTPIRNPVSKDSARRISDNNVQSCDGNSTETRLSNVKSDQTRFKPSKQGQSIQEQSIQEQSLQGQPKQEHLIQERLIQEQDISNRFNDSSNTRIKQSGDKLTHNTGTKTSPSAAAKTETPAGTQTKILKHRFLLESILGIGGMGVVYKAKDRLKVEAQDKDPYVAIKVLSEEFKTHPEAFIALQRESRKAQRIAHPNTVKVYDFDRDGDVVFMTMEYMDGKPLDKLIKQYQATGLPLDDAWHILSGMCSALAHAHMEKIVHSDFKPGNVFVTKEGMAKIFDFGIARAVANFDRHSGKEQDQTVFDAGGLGALTPAYASLEMLQGKTPDTRDDIYALGCVAYELFSGDHPFNRLPADEAYNKKLKPKRIKEISKTQWKAIALALAFKRDDRIESVDEFYRQLTFKKKSKFILLTSLLVVSAAAYYGYTQLNIVSMAAPQISESEIRHELEFTIRYNLFKEKIVKMLTKPSFTTEWEDGLWNETQGLLALLSEKPDSWYLSNKESIYQLYLIQIKTLKEKRKYNQTLAIIDNAYRYTEDFTFLNNEKLTVKDAFNAAIEQSSLQARKKADRTKRSLEKKRRTASKKATVIAEKKKTTSLFNVALSNVNMQLKCSSKLNMRDFNIAITKLRSLDFDRYAALENRLSTELAQCISVIGKRYPEHAVDSKRYALHIFKDNPAILAVVIKERDACDLSIAGLGARGDRAICRDNLKRGGVGPALVVIPGTSRIKAFSIAKYETSLAEMYEFCLSTSSCNADNHKGNDFPATNMDASTVSKYLKWLSKQTKKKYRLPTKKEWLYAAKSKTYALDPNRNCQLSTRGIEKGSELVKTATGKQNTWGLVNYAGNAREFAYDTGRTLVVLGGSYNALMENCTADTIASHSGTADQFTGFRVVRDVVLDIVLDVVLDVVQKTVGKQK